MKATNRPAFTLLEILVVIAIIAILIGLLLPAVQQVRAAAARTACQNNLKQMGLALHNYESANGRFPEGAMMPGEKYPFLSWMGQLLPYIEQDPLWSITLMAYDEQPYDPFHPPHLGILTPIKTYSCPSDARQAFAHNTHRGTRVALTGYLGNLGTNYLNPNGVLYRGSRTRFADVTDGTSSTIAAGERPPSPDYWYGWWYAGEGTSGTGSGDVVLGANELWNGYDLYTGDCPPGPYSYGPGQVTNMCDVFHYWSMHQTGANFLFVDGSVHFLPYSAASILPALATRAGGEVFSMDW